MRDVKLYIAVASARDWKPQFGSSAIGLVFNIGAHKLGERLSQIEFKIGSQGSVSEARDHALQDAIDKGFTHFLSLDDDMAFPMDSVEKMLAHKKPIVTANYCKKTPGQISPVIMGLDGKFLDSTGRTGIEEIGWLGLGLTLIDIEAAKQVAMPRFAFLWSDERQAYFDDSYAFSLRMREAGVTMWVDHDLSQEVSHIGDFPYAFPPLEAQLKQVA